MSKRIVKTDAVVLKRMDFLESSRIVTLFTRLDGRVSVLAKGARSKNNRFGSALEPGSYIQAVYYARPNREIQTLTQADRIERWGDMTRSMSQLSGAMHLLDLAHAVIQPAHAHEEMFDLLVRTLRVVGNIESGLSEVLLAYRLKVSHASGCAPVLRECVRCGRRFDETPLLPVLFDIRRGGLVCHSCGGGVPHDNGGVPGGQDSLVSVGAAHLQLLRSLQDSEVESLPGASVSRDDWNKLDHLLRSYERQHVLHGRTLKTEQMVREFIEA